MKKNKGITLIALIITIIILLILVGVSLNLVIKGDLFGSAEKAVEGTNAKTEQEQTRVDELMEKLNQMNDKEKSTTIIGEINDGISLTVTAEGGLGTLHAETQRLMELVTQLKNSFNETDKEQIIPEVKQILSDFDEASKTTCFNWEILLNGTLARDIAVSGMFLQIDNMSSDSLGLGNSSSIEAELATEESTSAYIEKVNQAMAKISENRSRCGAIESALGYLLNYYTEENNILNSNTTNMDKKIAKNGLTSISNALRRIQEWCETATDETINETDRKFLKEEMDAIIKAIDYISENCKYNEQKLLDGNYSNISKINSTTLGGGTKLGSDVSTVEKATALKTQYESAIEKVETELAKINV